MIDLPFLSSVINKKKSNIVISKTLKNNVTKHYSNDNLLQ